MQRFTGMRPCTQLSTCARSNQLHASGLQADEAWPTCYLEVSCKGYLPLEATEWLPSRLAWHREKTPTSASSGFPSTASSAGWDWVLLSLLLLKQPDTPILKTHRMRPCALPQGRAAVARCVPLLLAPGNAHATCALACGTLPQAR